MPFFDVAGLAWLQGWERLPPNPPEPPMPLGDFWQRMSAKHRTPMKAFAAMDRDQDGYLDFAELADGATFQAPLSNEQAKSVFDGLDRNHDHLLERAEFLQALGFDESSHPPSNHAVAGPMITTAAFAATTETTTIPLETTTALSTTTQTTAPQTTTARTTSTTHAPTTTSLTAKAVPPVAALVPIDMAHFKELLWASKHASAKEAFVFLDKNANQYVEPEEFTSATKELTPPLDAAQAADVFFRLDTSGDNRVEALELFRAFEAGEFLESTASTTPRFTIHEYKARMNHRPKVASLSMRILAIDFGALSYEAQDELKQSLVADLAFLAGVEPEAVMDLAGTSASVSLSGADPEPALFDCHADAPRGWSAQQLRYCCEHVGVGCTARLLAAPRARRLRLAAPRGLEVGALVSVPPREAPEDIVAVLASEATKEYLAHTVARSAGVRPTISGKLEARSIRITVTSRPLPIHGFADADKDGLLSRGEFRNAARSLSPPLAKEEAAFAFKHLDTDHDSHLTEAELEGKQRPSTTVGVPSTAAGAPTVRATAAKQDGHDISAPITMLEFKSRLEAAYPSAEAAFDACAQEGESALRLQEYIACWQSFRPGLDETTSEYAFLGMDANHDGKVGRSEFFAVIHAGRFFPSAAELKSAGFVHGRAEDPPITMAEFKDRMGQAGRPTGGARVLEDSAVASFLKLDSNHDQELDLSEFIAATEKFQPPLTKEQAEYAFASFDTDHDKRVTSGEFIGDVDKGHFSFRAAEKHYVTLGELKKLLGTAYQTPEAIFVGLDANHDGFSDHEEFVTGAAGLGMNPQQLDYAFHGLDMDHNNRLSSTELLQALRSDAARGAPLPSSPAAGLAPARSALAGTPAAITMAGFLQRLGATTQQDLFLALDLNRDGFLDQSEFNSPFAANRFNPPLNLEEADYAFKGLDSNHDGAVCISEFFGTLRVGDFYQAPEALQAVGAVIQQAPGSAPPAVGPAPPVVAPFAAPVAPPQPPAVAPPQAPVPQPPAAPPQAYVPQQPPQGAAGGPMSAAQLRARMETPQKTFLALDLDKDGFVSSQEYGTQVSAFNPPLSDQEADFTFGGLDADHDGRVSAAELLGAMRLGQFFAAPEAVLAAAAASWPAVPQVAPAAPAAPSALQQPHQAGQWMAPITEADFVGHMRSSFVSPQSAFQSLDANQDGGLDFTEFTTGVKAFRTPLDDTQAMYAFEGFDTDGDHNIAQREFFGDLLIGHFFQTQAAIDAASGAQAKGKAYDCNDRLQSWQADWLEDKQQWCCENAHKGCRISEPAEAGITVEQFVQRMGTRIASPGDAFNELDMNQDGFIALDELLANKNAFSPPLTEGDARAAVQGFDADGNGKVDGPEFLDAIQARQFIKTTRVVEKPRPTPKVWQATQESMTLNNFVKHFRTSDDSPANAFDAMDNNRDGYLTQAEFSVGASNFNAPITNEEAEYAFAGLDADGDLMLGKSEFLGVLKIGRFYQTPKTLEAAGVAIVKPATAPTIGASTAPPTNQSSTTPAPNSASPLANTTQAPIDASLPKGWELREAPITLPAFSARMGPTLPKTISVLNSTNGGCVDLIAFRRAADNFKPPLSREEADYAFCGMDENHDRRVCSFEFFGILKIGHFFPSRSHLEHLREVGALLERPGEEPHNPAEKRPHSQQAVPPTPPPPEQPAPVDVPGRPVPDGELELYRGVPAIVNGHAEITLHVSPVATPPGKKEDREIAEVFEKAMEKELKLHVRVSDVESFHVESSESDKISNGRDKTVMILWTAGTVDDGGSLQVTLRRKSADIENRIEDMIADKHFEWLERATVWAEVSLSYYGTHASKLPDGQKIAQDVGHKPGAASENGLPPYVPS